MTEELTHSPEDTALKQI